MKAMKFRVKDAEQSEALQRLLFTQGYGWYITEKIVHHENQPYIYVSEHACITFSSSIEEDYFNNKQYTEMNTEKYIQGIEEEQGKPEKFLEDAYDHKCHIEPTQPWRYPETNYKATISVDDPDIPTKKILEAFYLITGKEISVEEYNTLLYLKEQREHYQP